jgi:hypothetical protein
VGGRGAQGRPARRSAQAPPGPAPRPARGANGPKDGIFDALVNPGAPSLVDDCFTEFRIGGEFDLTSISDTITVATLSFVAENANTPAVIEIHGYEGDGSVSLIDIGFTGNLLGSTTGLLGTNSIDVTDFITNDLPGDLAGFSFDEALRQPSPLIDKFHSFQLTLETIDTINVPEPGTILLALSGLSGIFLTRRKFT